MILKNRLEIRCLSLRLQKVSFEILRLRKGAILTSGKESGACRSPLDKMRVAFILDPSLAHTNNSHASIGRFDACSQTKSNIVGLTIYVTVDR